MDTRWGCDLRVGRVGDYIVASLVSRELALLDKNYLISSLKSYFSSPFRLIGVTLENEGPGPWLIRALRDSLGDILNTAAFSDRSPLVRVAVVGVDRPTGKFFVHILPPSISMLGFMCQALGDEKPLRVLMGFDYHLWEYKGGSGRVRVQGDLVLEVLQQYDGSLDEAYNNTVIALAVDNVLTGLFDYVELAVKSRISRELSQIDEEEDLGEESVERAIMRGVFRASEDLLGVSIGIPEVQSLLPWIDEEVRRGTEYYRVDYSMLFADKWAWFAAGIHDDSEVIEYVRKASSIVKADSILYKPLLAMSDAPRPQGIKPQYYEALTGRLEDYEVPKPSILHWIIDKRQIVVNVTRPVNLIYTIMRSIVLEKLWTREAREWARLCSDPRSLDGFPPLLRSIGRNLCDLWRSSRILRVTLENHTLYGEAYRVTGTLYATSVFLEEAETIIRKIYRFAKSPTGAACTLDVLDALSRGLAAKTGEELVLIEGSVYIDHPEHGRAEIRFPKPVLARITTMNSWNP
ncbi:MAG: hypothetical protein F7C33_04235 [Desulfurococcales archaeon]|nr:hypothetical protein [Desulfurococcales archaeon]